MTLRREDVKQRDSSIDMRSRKRMTDKFILLPASCILKPHDRIDDSVFVGKVKVPVKIISSAILKFDKNEKQRDDLSSKILRCSSSKDILKSSYCDKLPKQPLTFIECITTSKSPLAKVTQCSTKTNESDGINYCIYLRSKAKKDSSCKIQPVIDSVERTIFDKKMRVSSERALSERSVSCRKSKPEVIHCSSPDYKLVCPDRADLKINISLFPQMKDPLSQITHKHSLDPVETVSSLKKPLRKYKRRIYPASCCQPVRSATKNICSDFSHAKSSSSDAKSLSIEIYAVQKRPGGQQLQRLAEKMLPTEVMRIESAKSDKVSACQRSAVAFRRACFIPEKVCGETLRLPSSQDLLARYKKFNIPAYQLERYKICRSKRNGLQDECIPRLLRTILQKEEQRQVLDKCIERNIDHQSGTSQSINLNDQTELLLYIE